MSNIDSLVSRGATFFCSHSGGKDSQAMYLFLREVVPHDQIVVVHADLGEVEWTGVRSHITQTIDHALSTVRAGKTLLEMVERRYESRPEVPSWPSSSTRQCTSDLKRGPIEKFIRQYMRNTGETLAVNCMGIRAEESTARSKKTPFRPNNRLSKAGREVYDWLPVFGLTTHEVFQSIADAGQAPFWAYKHNERLSCVFCIMGSRNDLRHGLLERPDLHRKYVELERKTGWSMFNGESLDERLGIIPLLEVA